MRPFWIVKLPPAALVAKFASTSVAGKLDGLRNADVGPFNTMFAALVTMSAPWTWSLPETRYVPPVSVEVVTQR